MQIRTPWGKRISMGDIARLEPATSAMRDSPASPTTRTGTQLPVLSDWLFRCGTDSEAACRGAVSEDADGMAFGGEGFPLRNRFCQA